jgi:predicted RNase H-like HicB family nuclease
MSEQPQSAIRNPHSAIETMSGSHVFSVGLEQGPDGFVRVHALDLLGCAAEGAGTEQALDAFAGVLAEWLHFLHAGGEPVPTSDAELEIAVDEWIETDADVAGGESDVCFAADLRRLTEAEISQGLRRLGDLRGPLLRAARSVPDAELDALRSGEWTARRLLDELARAQWWTLSRLGASPLAEVPERVLGRLDTAMGLVVDRFTTLSPEQRGAVLDLDGETWTPRKVLRRLLWLEWSLGRAARHALTRNG